ncbi:hypothetical protein PVK06_041277 [Gossypium arboreum]|uniref:Uncharacterized protein n=1 Tax=Gossypium arboreum TaxID=29729 RepID=A0ABR0N7T9_GOSAR|nr:hypothetical protein PVK06_041277 [Gossypium arboreum]
MEGDETSVQLVESAAPRVQRSFADFRGSHADSSSAATFSQHLHSPKVDMLRDYWQYSQLLQSSTDFHGQETTSLMEQIMQSSQLPNF